MSAQTASRMRACQALSRPSPSAPGGIAPARPSAPVVPPEERYQEQLRQLNEMGFWDAAKNLRALTLTGGNVHAAVEWLLSNP